MRKFLMPLLLAGLGTLLVSCQPGESFDLEKLPELTDMEEESDIMVTERGVKYLINPAELVGGGPPKDGIPSIDNPLFVSLAEADEWIGDDELIIGLVYNGVERAYPLQILVWHEIVNENIGGDPLLVTY